jgi:hypothetical protein
MIIGIRTLLNDAVSRLLLVAVFCCSLIALSQTAFAAPFGQGKFGANVPFGSATSLTISLGNNVTLGLTPNGQLFSATGAHTINVTSNDPVGYRLYIFTPNTNSLVSGANSIPASSNGTAAPLATNSWGYNTTGSSTDFIGLKTTPVLLKSADGPYKNGDATTVTYGAVADITKGAGSYIASVTYTAVAVNQ